MAADEDACSAADGGSCAPSVEDASAAEASTQQLEAMLDNGASAEELDAVLGEGTVLKPAPESATESAPTPPTAEELAAQAVALRKAGALATLNALHSPAPSVEADGSRAALTEAQNKQRELQGSVTTTEAELTEGKYGADGQWRALADKCFERTHHSYTYEVCLFGRASQREGSGSKTTLGLFTAWEDAAKGDAAFDEGPGAKYTPVKRAMKFANGQRCWNAGARELLVRFFCGGATEILSVDEPSTCHYEMKMSSPAAC